MLAAAALCLVLGAWIPWGGLFVNLATTFIGVVLTVFYVDRVIDRARSLQWSEADSEIRERLEQFANLSVSIPRTALGVPASVIPWVRPGPNARDEIRAGRRVIAIEHVKPEVRRGLSSFTSDQWRRLIEELGRLHHQGDRLLTLFGSRLSPHCTRSILAIQNCIWSMQCSYATFPDLIGVPDALVPPNRRGESGIPVKRAYETSLAESLEQILELAADFPDLAPARSA